MIHYPIPRHRFFFALLPPILLARQIANAAHWFGSDGKPLSAERLHITMFLLRDFLTVPNGLVDALRMLGNAVSAAPTSVALDLASGGERSIALRPRRKLSGLDVLHRLQGSGLGYRDRRTRRLSLQPAHDAGLSRRAAV